MQDEKVRGTNDDALASKLSAVHLDYLKDEFIHLFLKRNQKRAPIINRGTYTRTIAIDTIIESFVNQNSSTQIISLGAGSDTRYFNLKIKNKQPCLYVELDFDQITAKKAMVICKSKCKNLLQDVKIEKGGIDLISKDYWLLGVDLRQFHDIIDRLVAMGLDKLKPTLFLSECVLIYLDPVKSDEIINVASTFENSVFCTYEQIEPFDRFGLQMLENLKLRGLELPGIHKYPTLSSQAKRYIDVGYQVEAKEMTQVWESIDQVEKDRVAKLEIFDEFEEWNLLMSHYCLVVAKRGLVRA